MTEKAKREQQHAFHLKQGHFYENEALMRKSEMALTALEKECKRAHGLLKQRDKEIEAYHKELKKVKNAVTRWSKRSWLKRAFHRLRVDKNVKSLNLLISDEAGWLTLVEKAKKSALELRGIVRKVQTRRLGKWCLNVDCIQLADERMQRAQQAVLAGKQALAFSHWRKAAIIYEELIVRTRKKLLGLFCVNKRELVDSQYIIKSLLNEKVNNQQSLKKLAIDYHVKRRVINEEQAALNEGIVSSGSVNELVSLSPNTPTVTEWWPTSVAVFPDESLKDSFLLKAHLELEEFLSADARLSLTASENPTVSIVVPVYNKPAFLYPCLEAINKTLDLPYEVIVWDDASSVNMNALYDKIDGVKIIRSKTNLNFVLAVNEAVKNASGEYIVLLNSDAFLQNEAVSTSIDLLKSDQRIGAVGGCLILPDGIVQEAGNVVWKDGSCLGIGRGLRPDDTRLQHCRIVDYCSGAFLVTRRDTWNELGGFDPDFAPAYYEETDFCLRLKKGGLVTVYNPAAKVTHYEFGTNGASTAVDRILLNRDLLLKKHADLLVDHPNPGDWISYFRYSRQTFLQERWLYIDDLVPLSELGAGFPRTRKILNFISGLERQVTFVPILHNHTFTQNSKDEVFRWVEIISPVDQESFRQFILQEVQGFDVIFVSRPHNKSLLDSIFSVIQEQGEFKRPVIIYDAEAIFAERDILKYKVLYGKEMPDKDALLLSELALTKTADMLTAVTERDKLKLSMLDENKILHVLGHTVKIRKNTPKFEDRAGLLFVGPIVSDCSPNADSIYWMLDNVLPLLRKRASLTFKLVGRVLTRQIYEHLASDFVHVGPQANVEPFYDDARVFVCPTRYAAGMPLKMVEAMSAGIPIVCTPLMAGQMNVSHEKEVLIADSPEAFADAILRLHSDSSLWYSLQNAAYDHAARMYSSEHFKGAIQNLCFEASNLLKERNLNTICSAND